LNLRLFVHREHHCGFGRIQVQPDDVADLVDEQRIGRQFQLSTWCGLSPNARQIRDTAV